MTGALPVPSQKYIACRAITAAIAVLIFYTLDKNCYITVLFRNVNTQLEQQNFVVIKNYRINLRRFLYSIGLLVPVIRYLHYEYIEKFKAKSFK